MKTRVILMLMLGIVDVLANPISKQTSENKNPHHAVSESQTKHEEAINSDSYNKGAQEQKKDNTIDNSETLYTDTTAKDVEEKVEIVIEDNIVGSNDDGPNVQGSTEKKDTTIENPETPNVDSTANDFDEKVEIIIEEDIVSSNDGDDNPTLPETIEDCPQLPGYNENGPQLPGLNTLQQPGFLGKGPKVPENGQEQPEYFASGPQQPGFLGSDSKLPGFIDNGPPIPGFIDNEPPIPGFLDNGPPIPGFHNGPQMPGFLSNGPHLPGDIGPEQPYIDSLAMPGFFGNGPLMPEDGPEIPNEIEDGFAIDKDYFREDSPMKVEHEIMETAAGFVPTPLVFRRKQKPRRRLHSPTRRHFRRNPHRRHQLQFIYPYYAFYRYHPSSLRYY